jgi:hypothetical protein
MIRTLIATVLAILAALLWFATFQPHGSAAASPPYVESAPAVAFPGSTLPPIQAPFDETTITPVESAGAPMYEP